MLVSMHAPRCVTISKSLRTLVSTMSKAYSAASTVDDKETAHFKNMSRAWWDHSQSGPLQAMNRLRVPFIRDGLINTALVKPEYVNTPQPLKGLAILDVGCGGGVLSEALARIGGNVTGVDTTAELIDVAKQHAALDPSLTNLTYEFSKIEEYYVNNTEKYDAIISSEVIEHITDKKLFVESCIKCLKPGGSIFFTTFNRTNIAWFVGVICAEYLTRALPIGTHDYEKFIAPHQLQRLLEDYNCHTTVVHGMWYNYFTNTWSWTSNNWLTYALQAVKS